MLLQQLLNGGSATGPLLNKCNCFNLSTDDKWRVSELMKPLFTNFLLFGF